MTSADIRKELRKAARALGQIAPDVGTGKGKAYEVWLLLEVCVRLRGRGYRVAAVDHVGSPVRKFRARGSPGGMPSGPSTGREPCHVEIDGRGGFELHLGLQHLGGGGATHEIDLALLPAEAAVDCRGGGGGAYDGPHWVAIEAKAYDSKHKLDQSIARALVGVAADLDPLSVLDRVSVWAGRGRPVPLHSARLRPVSILATSTGVYDNSRRLLDGFSMVCFDRLVPASSAAALDKLAEHFGRALRAGH